MKIYLQMKVFLSLAFSIEKLIQNFNELMEHINFQEKKNLKP